MNIIHAVCEIQFQADAPVPVVFMLRPRSGPAQWISNESYEIEPFTSVIEYTDILGNLCQRAILPAGPSEVTARCTATTSETVDIDQGAAFVPPEMLPESVLHFLLPSRYCPSDRLGYLSHEIVGGAAPGYPQVEAIRTWIHENIKYQYGTSTSATTAYDTANSRQGVCRDFAHLGVAFCRALNIPARMVVGYTEKLVVPDIHAWFEAFVGGRWYVFDATHAHTAGNRIAIAFGRDATDVAFVTQFAPLTLLQLKVTVTAEPAG